MNSHKLVSVGAVSRRQLLSALGAACALSAFDSASAQRFEIPIPEGNRPNLTEAPRRPGPGRVEEDARILFDAIKQNDPEVGIDFFMPLDIFRAVKGISDPDGLHARIVRLFHRDVAELHEALTEVTEAAGVSIEDAEFDRFEFSRRRGWVELREESNRLPYWAQRHNWLYYRVGEAEHRFEVRTMIAWGDRWYITHLNEFRR